MCWVSWMCRYALLGYTTYCAPLRACQIAVGGLNLLLRKRKEKPFYLPQKGGIGFPQTTKIIPTNWAPS
uniref:Uncharacterized protein n=1 Tax=Arundo donax TaxID=35708 RepID=A0A0A9HQU4_ARUDO